MTDQTRALEPASNALTFGQTALDATQFVPPRVKIVQLMSDERTAKVAVEGDFFNTLTGENYGNEMKFLPLQPFMNRVLLVRDENRAKVEAKLDVGKTKFKFDDGAGVMKCRSLDMVQGVGEPGIECAQCPLALWDGRNAPACTEVYNVAALSELGDLIILQFSRSSAKVGRKLFSMIRLGRPGQAPWLRFYNIKTMEIAGAKGTYAVPMVTQLQEAPPTELMGYAKHWFGQLAGMGPIDVTPPEEEAEEGGEPDPNAPF